MWSFGGNAFGSSRLHVVTSTSCAKSSCSNVSCVPQAAQKLRSAFGVERKLAGLPFMTLNCDRGTLNHATNGAPVVRRQIEQWQLDSLNGSPAASYRTLPQ